LKKLPELDSEEAAKVLPTGSDTLSPSLGWGPALAYIVLDAMSESNPLTALALFDRLRLREPLARAFSGGGDVQEDGWRAAARLRLAFRIQTMPPDKPAKDTESFAGLPGEFWKDEDARWLLNLHEVAGESYFNKELHEQMLWWTELPRLLGLADTEGEPQKAAKKGSAKKAVQNSRETVSLLTIQEKIKDASEEAEEAGFRLSKKKGPAPTAEEPASTDESTQEKGALAK
jgi:hypothetical protein